MSKALKFFLILFLILLMQIPMWMVGDLVRERSNYQQEAITDITQQWAGPQTLIGPILVVPYTRKETLTENNVTRQVAIKRHLYLLPDTFTVKGNLAPEVRKRGIYQAVLYQGQLLLSGKFIPQLPSTLDVDPKSVHWQDAFFYVGVTDRRGIQPRTALRVNNAPLAIIPGSINDELPQQGLTMPLGKHLTPNAPLTYAMDLDLRGSDRLQILPVGKDSRIALASSWADPSFEGFLPEARRVTAQGFEANWAVSFFAREIPQYWKDSVLHLFTSGNASAVNYAPGLEKSTVTVGLLQLADHYQKTERAMKYGILFTSLTFLAYFMIEVGRKLRIHAIHYILVGVALAVFFLLLLSLAEVVGFNWAYGSAALATVLLIAGYTRSIAPRQQHPIFMWFASLLSFLYVYLFVLLQLKDYSLLIGAVGLFIILAVVMNITRQINWYQEDSDERPAS